MKTGKHTPAIGRGKITLLGSLRKSLTLDPFHLERLGLIDNHDYSGVCRKVTDEAAAHGQETSPAYLDAGVLALKQYYAVALLDPRNEHAVSDGVDPFWHAHILHTRAYAAFCEEVFGQFIHHEPLNHADQGAVRKVAALYAHTQGVYTQIFDYVDRTFYPVTMPDARLICTHYEVLARPVREYGLFDSAPATLIPWLAAA